MHFGEMHGSEDFLGVGKCNFISVKTVNLYLVHQLLKKERKKEKKEKGKEWDSCLQLSPAETRLYIPPFIITWFFS